MFPYSFTTAVLFPVRSIRFSLSVVCLVVIAAVSALDSFSCSVPLRFVESLWCRCVLGHRR